MEEFHNIEYIWCKISLEPPPPTAKIHISIQMLFLSIEIFPYKVC